MGTGQLHRTHPLIFNFSFTPPPPPPPTHPNLPSLYPLFFCYLSYEFSSLSVPSPSLFPSIIFVPAPESPTTVQTKKNTNAICTSIISTLEFAQLTASSAASLPRLTSH